jgi:hypothetical protein
VLTGLFEGVGEGLPAEPANVTDPGGVFDLYAQRLVDVETVHPGLGETEGGECASAHVSGDPGQAVFSAHVREGLDDACPPATPPLDDVLGAHSPPLLDRTLAKRLDVVGCLPLLDLPTVLKGVGAQVFEVGEMCDGVPNRPRLVRGDQVPDLDWDPLKGLIQELLFRYEIGEDVAHKTILVAILEKAPSWTAPTRVFLPAPRSCSPGSPLSREDWPDR